MSPHVDGSKKVKNQNKSGVSKSNKETIPWIKDGLACYENESMNCLRIAILNSNHSNTVIAQKLAHHTQFISDY